MNPNTRANVIMTTIPIPTEVLQAAGVLIKDGKDGPEAYSLELNRLVDDQKIDPKGTQHWYQAQIKERSIIKVKFVHPNQEATDPKTGNLVVLLYYKARSSTATNDGPYGSAMAHGDGAGNVDQIVDRPLENEFLYCRVMGLDNAVSSSEPYQLMVEKLERVMHFTNHEQVSILKG
ncbi:MAG: hypothetical protein R3E79_42245 [Caldilineaceae bacterium]